MKHPPPFNRWNYPVYIKPARRVRSGSRVVLPIPLTRRIEPRATIGSELAFYGTVAMLLAPCFWLLWRAAFER